MSRTSASDKRSYHHGDLRAALCLAGYELAAAGGAQAVTLRAATRLAGVSPAAAYRHFASHDDLRLAVGAMAMAELARSIERHQSAVTATEPETRAKQRLVAVGDGYISFALDTPGAFDVALFGLFTMEHAFDPATMGPTGRTPFELLTDAIGELVALGLLPPASAEAVAITCWSSVHGFATLATSGPLREHPRTELDAMGRQIVRGLTVSLLSSFSGPAG
ncbi:MAG TPA: TetR/AcrR family transcriptional regulator [Propionicimonas sp.]|uniref:TetR/AcrR family transcriptional regulator n=1 Tax=Propionicimonas sp. TaxID=1955623 RepID=UPI002F4132EE